MKKILLSGIVVLMSSTLFAQHSLEKVWETDSSDIAESGICALRPNIEFALCVQHGRRNNCALLVSMEN